MLVEPLKISRRLAIGPQPESEEEIAQLVKRGFRSIVNLSKKGELDQVFNPEQEGEIVTSLGIEYHHMPVSLSNLKDADIQAFCQLLQDIEGPTYVHCRIGQRACPLSLIFHGKSRKLSAEQVTEKASKLGLEWDAPIIPELIKKHLEGHAA